MKHIIKALALALASIFIFSMLSFAGFGAFRIGYLLGDVNGNGEITAQDALWVLQIASQKREADDIQRQAADINNDGEVTGYDALILLKIAAGRYQKSEPSEVISSEEVSSETVDSEDTTSSEVSSEYTSSEDSSPDVSSSETVSEPQPPKDGKYTVKEVNKMPQGQEIALKNVESLGFVTGWEKSEALVVASLDELQSCGIELPAELLQKYSEEFLRKTRLYL